MKENLQYKLEQIASVWRDYICEYNFCKHKTKFAPEVKSNYFGDIIGYFGDTFDIIFDKRESNSYSVGFSNQISFLQSIYIQQDFIEELLLIFKCKTHKGDLKKDDNYLINRNIRNELVGHPIRKQYGEFISSCLFGYNGGSNHITYLRYHKDNNYEFESMAFEVSDIILRHYNFLVKYFDEILNKLKRILTSFVKEIEKLEAFIQTKSFNDILKITSAFFESIFKYDFIYDKESLLKIYARRGEHRRYQNLIDNFYRDLKSSLNAKKNSAIEVFQAKKAIEEYEIIRPTLNLDSIKLIELSKKIKTENQVITIPYNYELGKLATQRNLMDFSHFGSTLKLKCAGNQIILDELEHMELNFYDEIEYYSAFSLIWSILINND